MKLEWVKAHPDIHRQAVVAQLLGQFMFQVADFMTSIELREAVQRNQMRPPATGGTYRDCHLHDFCDANQAMINAFDEVFGEDTWELQDDLVMSLMNEVWEKSDAVFDLIYPRGEL